MKRSISTVVIFIIFLLFLVNQPVNAATPTPTSSASLPTDAEPIPNGSFNQRLGQGANREDVPITPTPNVIYNYSVNQFDVNPSVKNFKVPLLDEYANWLTRVIPYMSAKQIKDNIKPHQDNLYISGKVKRCIYFLGAIIEDQGDVYKTERVTYLPPLITSNELLSAQTVRNIVKPINGEYNFEGPAYEINTEDLPCGKDGDGTTQDPPKLISLVVGSNILAWFRERIAELVNDIRVEIVSKQQTPESERIHCLLSGCVNESFNDDLNLKYMKKPEKETIVKQSGGVVDAGFRTIQMDTTKKKSPQGQEPNFTKTNTSFTKQMENSAQLIRCSLVPPAQRAVLGLTTENCSDFVENLPTTTSCDINLSDLTVNPECKLKINTLGLPTNLITAIEAAASAFKVPSSLIVGIIFGEGGFKSGSIYLNSTEMETYLDGCATLPNCDPNGANINNIVPFMQQYWPNLSDAIKVVDPNRTPNACNLIDGIFALAKDLSKNQYGSPAFVGKTCFGIALNSGSGGSSSCNWSDSAAETAIRVWEFGTGWDNTKKSCATKLNSCYMGGGLAAQCPTGGDTCETISTRYTQISHNGCIWDVYKNN